MDQSFEADYHNKNLVSRGHYDFITRLKHFTRMSMASQLVAAECQKALTAHLQRASGSATSNQVNPIQISETATTERQQTNNRGLGNDSGNADEEE